MYFIKYTQLTINSLKVWVEQGGFINMIKCVYIIIIKNTGSISTNILTRVKYIPTHSVLTRMDIQEMRTFDKI